MTKQLLNNKLVISYISGRVVVTLDVPRLPTEYLVVSRFQDHLLVLL